MTNLHLVQETIQQPWEVVAEAFWRGFPTHEKFPELEKVEILEKTFDERNSQASIKCKFFYNFEIPYLVKKVLGSEESGFRMTARIDVRWKDRSMTIEANSEVDKIMLREMLSYEAHVANSNWTHVSLTGSHTCDLFLGLAQIASNFLTNVYETKMEKRKERDQEIIPLVLRDGVPPLGQPPPALSLQFGQPAGYPSVGRPSTGPTSSSVPSSAVPAGPSGSQPPHPPPDRGSIRASARGSAPRNPRRIAPGGIKPSFTPLHVFGRATYETAAQTRNKDEKSLFTHYQTLPEQREAEAEAARSNIVMF